MGRPKRVTVRTWAPAHTPAAIEEWKTGVEVFLEWANRARTGETSLPAAVQADHALTAFSEGRFHVRFSGLSAVAVVHGQNVLHLVRDAHWHLRPCPFCNRWLLAKDQRRTFCRRVECVRRKKARQKQSERKVHLR